MWHRWWFFRAIDRRVVSLGRAVLARGYDTINTTRVAFAGTDSCVSDVAPAVVGGLALAVHVLVVSQTRWVMALGRRVYFKRCFAEDLLAPRVYITTSLLVGLRISVMSVGE